MKIYQIWISDFDGKFEQRFSFDFWGKNYVRINIRISEIIMKFSFSRKIATIYVLLDCNVKILFR